MWQDQIEELSSRVENLGRQVNVARGELLVTRLTTQHIQAEVDRLKAPEIPGLEPKEEGTGVTRRRCRSRLSNPWIGKLASPC